ncbi:hypothetical protein GCM10028824_41560 [Hymenobacter segetis]
MQQSPTAQEAIRQCFEDDDVFFECLLLEYNYAPTAHSFTWVGAPGLFFGPDRPGRLFVRLHFTGVSEFQHPYPTGPGTAMTEATHSFFAPDYKGTYESEESRLTNQDGRYHLTITLPHRLGTLHFHFVEVEVSFLLATPVPTGETVTYVSPTQQVLDFYRPFSSQNDR